MYKGPPIVSDDAHTPGGRPGHCTWCQEPDGVPHDPECVLPKRTVVIEYRVVLVESVPAYWGAHQVEFHRNDSSWCASNLISPLTAIQDTDRCLCPNVAGRYVREATLQDEDMLGWTPRGDS